MVVHKKTFHTQCIAIEDEQQYGSQLYSNIYILFEIGYNYIAQNLYEIYFQTAWTMNILCKKCQNII